MSDVISVLCPAVHSYVRCSKSENGQKSAVLLLHSTVDILYVQYIIGYTVCTVCSAL